MPACTYGANDKTKGWEDCSVVRTLGIKAGVFRFDSTAPKLKRKKIQHSVHSCNSSLGGWEVETSRPWELKGKPV